MNIDIHRCVHLCKRTHAVYNYICYVRDMHSVCFGEDCVQIVCLNMPHDYVPLKNLVELLIQTCYWLYGRKVLYIDFLSLPFMLDGETLYSQLAMKTDFAIFCLCRFDAFTGPVAPDLQTINWIFFSRDLDCILSFSQLLCNTNKFQLAI